MFGLVQPSLRVIPYGEIAFLHLNPPSANPEGANNDAVVQGDVVLTLPRARQLPGPIIIRLVGEYEIRFPSGLTETGTVLEQEAIVETNGVTYEKGDHTFHFLFRVPPTAPTHENNEYGRVHYFVRAETKGLGLGGMKLAASRQFYIILNTANDGDLLRYHHQVQNYTPELGPFVMTLTAPHLTVASPVVLAFEAPSVPHNVSILSVSLSINQTVVLTSPSRPAMKSVTPAARKVHVFTVDTDQPPSRGSHPPTKNSLANLIPGGPAFSLTHKARLPGDDTLRASTTCVFDEETGREGVYPFVLSHEAAMSVTFRVEAQAVKTLWVKRPIHISSCCCSLESHLVPPYAVDDPLSGLSRPLKTLSEITPERIMANRCEITCLCGTTFAVMMKQFALPGGGDGIFDPTSATSLSVREDPDGMDGITRDWKVLSARRV